MRLDSRDALSSVYAKPTRMTRDKALPRLHQAGLPRSGSQDLSPKWDSFPKTFPASCARE